MKKLTLALGVALLFSACGNSLDDEQKKNGNYYLEHRDEAVKKTKWCLDELDISVDEYLAYASGIEEEYEEASRLSKMKVEEYEYQMWKGKVKRSEEAIAKDNKTKEDAQKRLDEIQKTYSSALQLIDLDKTEKLDGVNKYNCSALLLGFGRREFMAEFEKKYK